MSPEKFNLLAWIESEKVKKYCADMKDGIIPFTDGYQMIRWFMAYQDAEGAMDDRVKDLALIFYSGMKGYKEETDEEVFEEFIEIFGENDDPMELVNMLNEHYKI